MPILKCTYSNRSFNTGLVLTKHDRCLACIILRADHLWSIGLQFNVMFKGLITVGRKLLWFVVICCPPGPSLELRSRDVPAPDNKSLGCCCRNSRPTVINPDYNMNKQRYIPPIYDKIRSRPPPIRATSPTCLHSDVTHLSLTTGVVALYIRRVGVREEHRQARKTVCSVNAARVICRYQNNLCGIINHH